MRAFWRVNGQESTEPKPSTDGRLCRVIDLENGEIPISVYGKTVEEVYGKIERTNMHAQIRIASGSPRATPGRAPAAPTPPPARSLALEPAERMQATRELTDPAKAPSAMVKLFEHETGIDTEKLAAEAFAARAQAWQARHPELVDNAFNMKLITDNARMRVGGNIRLVTAEILEPAYQELKAQGFLLTESDPVLRDDPPPTLPAQPGENPAPRARQTETAPFATSHRSNRVAGSGAPPAWKPKYSREEIDRMPFDQADKLLRARDPEYLAAVQAAYPTPRRAMA